MLRKIVLTVSSLFLLSAVQTQAQVTPPVTDSAERNQKFCNWNGGFDTPFGRLNLAQAGKIVTGTYTKVGYIAGVFDADCVLQGLFSNRNTDRYGYFEFSPNAGGFSGKWRWMDSDDFKIWTGQRVNSRAGGGGLPGKPKCNWTGRYIFSDDIIALRQTGAHVVGESETHQQSPMGPWVATAYKGKVDGNCVLIGTYLRKSRGMLDRTTQYYNGIIRLKLYGDVVAGFQNHENTGDKPSSGFRMSGWGLPEDLAENE